jgi:hypothetical protein
MTSLLQSLKLLKLMLATSIGILQDVCTRQWPWMYALFIG